MELELENETLERDVETARKHLVAAITADEEVDIVRSAEAYLEALNHRRER
jgi:hypothetical protein